MSKIVILRVRIGISATNLIQDLISQLNIKNKAASEYIENYNFLNIIKDCMSNAANLLCKEFSFNKTNTVADQAGNNRSKFNGTNLIVLKSSRLPLGLGIGLDKKGKIAYTADYKNGSQNEIQKMRQLFEDAFTAEIDKAILKIIGYQTNIRCQKEGNGALFLVEGVKQ